MGLAARAIEDAGVATVVLSWCPAVTASVGAPRVVGIEMPGAHPLGPPGDAATQRSAVAGALDLVITAEHPGTVVDLPIALPPVPGERRRAHPPQPSPIASLIRRKPWLLARLMSGRIPQSR
ncbi:MAG: hypothetical protein D6689_04490 [Deltaproteobacteria bacterium]|nr:MAG: hypothetical protein D6689_04490 [Deltaproteobacteria bacterium]